MKACPTNTYSFTAERSENRLLKSGSMKDRNSST